MATEPIQGGPYPVPADPPDGPGQMHALATWAAGRTVMRFASIAARDAALPSPVDGMLCYVAADKTYYGRSDGEWRPWWRAWTSWTPLLTGLATNPSLGSSGIATGKYAISGGTVHAQGRFAFGGSGVSGGSGEYQVPLPVAAKNPAEALFYGTAWLFDGSASQTNIAACLVQPSGIFNFRHHGGTSIVDAGRPWIWATGDQIRFQLEYEAA